MISRCSDERVEVACTFNLPVLNVGAPADVAVLELRGGAFEFVDNFENKRTGRQRLFPSATVLAGKLVATRA